MAENNTPLALTLPPEQIEPVIISINELGLPELTTMAIEDLDAEEKILANIVHRTRNICWDLTESAVALEKLRDNVNTGAAIAYFVLSHCRPRPIEAPIGPLSGFILFSGLGMAVESSGDNIYRFLVNQYQKDFALQTIFARLGFDSTDPASTFAQIGAGTISYYLNEYENIRRSASYN